MAALGIDAGGTATRWALVDAAGTVVAQGAVAGMSANQRHDDAGRAAMRAVMAALAAQVTAAGAAPPQRICLGLTGYDGVATEPAQWLAAALGVAVAAVNVRSDIELAYLGSFEPGAGYLVYAGTGSIAAWVDRDGVLHRAGGRGVYLDDGGGGYWIAREAMRAIWRREDEQPGAWRASPMAQAVFEHVGGSDWAASRQFIYGQERGAVGRLALAVAAAAETDPEARDLLERAGQELARLALALVGRYGDRRVALAGGAASLHPLIEQAMRAALPASLSLTSVRSPAHHAAARIALHSPH